MTKNIIICNKFYADVLLLEKIVSGLSFEECVYGKEVKEFYYIPQSIESLFNYILNEDIEIQQNSGKFIKPNSSILFEEFYEHSLWKCVVALEDTNLNVYKQESIETFFDVKSIETFIQENSFDKTKWDLHRSINVKKNEFIFFRPWIWHSFEEDKLIQSFLINKKLVLE
jgi:hypothetical protein